MISVNYLYDVLERDYSFPGFFSCFIIIISQGFLQYKLILLSDLA